MADPVIVNCPDKTWTKVASSVTTGVIWLKDSTPQYRQTYRVAGNPAPTDLADGKRFQGEGMLISSGSAIDVYIYPTGGEGKVRVDL